MLVVTARLFKDNQLVGYRLSDGQAIQDFTKQQAWLYAKNKQILNVVATGTEEDPGLSGTNGFELKKLPEIKWQDTSKKKYTKEEVDAAVLRDTIKRGYFGYDLSTDKAYGSVRHEAIKNDIDTGVLNYNKSKILSDSILIEKELYNPIKSGYIIGYKIKNIGEQPIPITRITVKSDHVTSETVLNPSESICINRAELALLASKPEVGCTFNNGILFVGSSEYKEHWYSVLDNCSIMAHTVLGDPIDIRLLVDEQPEIVDKYLCPIVELMKLGKRFNTRTLAKGLKNPNPHKRNQAYSTCLNVNQSNNPQPNN